MILYNFMVLMTVYIMTKNLLTAKGRFSTDIWFCAELLWVNERFKKSQS